MAWSRRVRQELYPETRFDDVRCDVLDDQFWTADAEGASVPRLSTRGSHQTIESSEESSLRTCRPGDTVRVPGRRAGPILNLSI